METIRSFFQRLSHKGLGSTELVVFDTSGRLLGTGFFENEEAFVSAVLKFNRECGVYAGRNPRSFEATNRIVGRKRAKDSDIEHITALSLDIDPIRPRGKPATKKQRELALDLAKEIRRDLGGYIDDSGNGAYVWFRFKTPIQLTTKNREEVKQHFESWHKKLKQAYQRDGVRIDGCYDFSRIKRVIGSYNHKAGRQSGFVVEGKSSDSVRDEILKCKPLVVNRIEVPDFIPSTNIPSFFYSMLEWDYATRDLWENPDRDQDRSRHDWMLTRRCIEAGIKEGEDLAGILIRNPHGKYARDRRMDYVIRTVRRALEFE